MFTKYLSYKENDEGHIVPRNNHIKTTMSYEDSLSVLKTQMKKYKNMTLFDKIKQIQISSKILPQGEKS